MRSTGRTRASRRNNYCVTVYVRHASRRPRISKNASSWGRKKADRRSSTSTGRPSSSYAPWMDQPMRSSNEGNVLAIFFLTAVSVTSSMSSCADQIDLTILLEKFQEQTICIHSHFFGLATIEAGFGGLDQFNASLKGVVADLLKRAADTPRGGPSFSVRSSTSNL